MSSPDTTLPPAAQAALDEGRRHHEARDLAAALQAYQRANALAPDSEPVLAALGALAMDARDWPAAERIHRLLETRFPGRHLARLALAVFNQQRHADALPLFERMAGAGNIDANCALAYAMCLERCGHPERAIGVMISIYRATGGEQMAVLLISAFLRLGRRAELDEWLPRVLAAHPDNGQLLAARSEHGFLSGDYGTGFDYVRHRWAVAMEKPKAAEMACPYWDGQPFDGTLLVTAEQGLGDEILSSSMFEELVARGQHAIIDCEPRLLPVFRRSFPALAFADRSNRELVQSGLDPRNRKIEALELGRFFRRDMADMPRRTSWLSADPQRVAHWRRWLAEQFPGRRTVGLSWRSNRHLLGDSKTIPLGALGGLLENPGLACINLQYGDIAPDLATLPSPTASRLHLAPGLDATRNIDDLFALIAALDAVVTCSNTTAHIAGAQGMPTFVMLPGSRYVLWYWGHDGARTPWYPSLQLFRGPPRKDWQALAGDVLATLAAMPGAGS